MLAIRLQRVGRKGYAQYRVVVQEAQRSPSSGRVVANIGRYDPHTKTATLDKDAAATYLKNGAQPSERVVKLFQADKIALPDWVELPKTTTKRSTKNPDKLRKNQPAEPAKETTEAATDEVTPEDATTTEESETPETTPDDSSSADTDKQ